MKLSEAEFDVLTNALANHLAKLSRERKATTRPTRLQYVNAAYEVGEQAMDWLYANGGHRSEYAYPSDKPQLVTAVVLAVNEYASKYANAFSPERVSDVNVVNVIRSAQSKIREFHG